MQIKINKKNVFIYVGLFVLIYNPPFIPFNAMHIIGAVSILGIVLEHYNVPVSPRFPSNRLNTWVFFALITLYLTLIAVIKRQGNLDIIYSPLYFVIDIIPFAYYVCRNGLIQNGDSESFFELLLKVACLQGAIGLIAYFFRPFQGFLLKFFECYGYGNSFLAMSSIRLFGFAGELTFTTPLFQSIMSICAIYYSISHPESGRVKLWMEAIILAFTAIINARISLIALIAGFIALILFSKMNINKRIILAILLGIIMAVVFFTILPVYESSSGSNSEWIMEGYKEIKAFLHGQVLSDSYFSYVTNKDRYILPNGFINILFGTGHNIINGLSTYGVYTDVGFINDIWVGGIFYILLIYIFYGTVLVRLIKNADNIWKFFATYCLILLPIANIKGQVFGMNDLTVSIIIVYLCILGKYDYICLENKNVRFNQRYCSSL